MIHCTRLFVLLLVLLSLSFYNRLVLANADTVSLAYQHYLQLKAMLPIYENALHEAWPVIPMVSKLLKEGSKGSVIITIRDYLKHTQDLETTTTAQETSRFDKRLVAAVKRFQLRHGLQADGVIGNTTLAAMQVPPQEREKQIRLNMQRWLELAHETPDRYLLVNIPEYQLHLIDANKEVMSMKVIVGKPDRQTPELSSVITRLTFNPYWNVPPQIAQRDIIPKVLNNPAYLSEMRIRIYSSEGGDSDEMNEDEIDWQNEAENGFNYFFRQEPGDNNALGLVKFEFANDHNIYLHDTPAKNLFAATKRDFSSGCVRLENPFNLVQYLIQDDAGIDVEHIKDILSTTQTKTYRLKNPLPIYITYITSWVDSDGLLHFLDDVYGRDTI